MSTMSIAEAFTDVPVATHVMIGDSELMKHSDEIEDKMRSGFIATDGARSPSDSSDIPDSTLASNKEQMTSSQTSNGDDNA